MQFYTVRLTNYRLGDIDSQRDKHFEIKEDAKSYYNELKGHYTDSTSYVDANEQEENERLIFEVNATNDKWSYSIEMFKQELN